MPWTISFFYSHHNFRSANDLVCVLFFFYGFDMLFLEKRFETHRTVKRCIVIMKNDPYHQKYLSKFLIQFDLVWFYSISTSLYIYVEYTWFGLVGFYGISTIVGDLMVNPLYTYILNTCGLIWLVFMIHQAL